MAEPVDLRADAVPQLHDVVVVAALVGEQPRSALLVGCTISSDRLRGGKAGVVLSMTMPSG
jgi:hypothetical protein